MKSTPKNGGIIPNGVKICKICKSAKFYDILEIGAKACKIPQIQLYICVEHKERNAENASFLAIVAVHTEENEPPKVLKN